MTLIVHSGGFTATREEVEAVPVPEPDPESRWHPFPYSEFLEEIINATEKAGVSVAWNNARYALAREGKQLFGIADVIVPDYAKDYTAQIGFRQSYDQSLSAGLVLGHRVFVCDNLCFAGEFQVFARNTKEIQVVFPARIREAAYKIYRWIEGMRGEIDLMKRIHPSQWELDHILVEAIRRHIIPGSKMSAILEELHEPEYDIDDSANGNPSLWRQFNAITKIQRDRSPIVQFRTGTPLLSLFREHGLRERRKELTEQQRQALEDMERETAQVWDAELLNPAYRN